MFFVVNRHATPARESASLVEIPGRLSWQAFVPGFRAGFLPALENPAVPTQAFAEFHETDSDPAQKPRTGWPISVKTVSHAAQPNGKIKEARIIPAAMLRSLFNIQIPVLSPYRAESCTSFISVFPGSY